MEGGPTGRNQWTDNLQIEFSGVIQSVTDDDGGGDRGPMFEIFADEYLTLRGRALGVGSSFLDYDLTSRSDGMSAVAGEAARDLRVPIEPDRRGRNGPIAAASLQKNAQNATHPRIADVRSVDHNEHARRRAAMPRPPALPGMRRRRSRAVGGRNRLSISSLPACEPGGSVVNRASRRVLLAGRGQATTGPARRCAQRSDSRPMR